ncbi:SDR family oxidoreductase [Salicibibacter kimchii]|uniref:SDR family NAD(P)-dependent oxidoreductase n=1 Tax=Salicibibacter kimchii TaxID=2099786 RepID=A0A345BYS0_9BACI|nr:SDR family oxidoreductase [Salicibibacter kimchii]AXF56101.1 SDR family NAD(P)-dependent oxidoreductase [Salicibibacter kimchii]
MSLLDLFNIKGKTAIVTGGGRGLGAQFAETMAESSANVVLCSRRLENCEDVAKQLKDEYGVETLALQCDVTDQADVDHLVAKTQEKFGSIDILINNSGATWGAPVVDLPLDAWKKVIDVNITGTFLMSQAVGRVMIEQGGGRMINISSVAALKNSMPEMMDTIPYNTSKGAIINFTKDLAVKWGRHNINVNAIAPGWFKTKMSKELMEKNNQAMLTFTPLRRFGGDDDLKGVTLFLASDASKYITGDVVVVDGGTSLM